MPPPPDRPEFWIEDAADDGWNNDVRSGSDGERSSRSGGSRQNAGPTSADWLGGDERYGASASAWDNSDDAINASARAGHDSSGPPGRLPPGRTGGQRRWLRWTALAAGLAVIAGIIVWQNRASATAGDDASTAQTSPSAPGTDLRTSRAATDGALRSPPSKTEETPNAVMGWMISDTETLPDEQGWELLAFTRSAGHGSATSDARPSVIHYQPTGSLHGYILPSLQSTGPVSFAVSGGTAIIRPLDAVPGYVVSPQGEVSTADGLLGPDDGVYVVPTDAYPLVWAVSFTASPAWARLSDMAGVALSSEILLPDRPYGINQAGAISSDGAGNLVVPAVGGTYLIRQFPDPPRKRLTTGLVLASGPTGFLTYDCDDAAECAVNYLRRGDWSSARVPGFQPPNPGSLPTGVISPDGAVAAMVGYGGDGAVVYLVNLATGAVTNIAVSLVDSYTHDGGSLLAFSPDGRYLMVASAQGVVPVEVATGTALEPLPTGPVEALAVNVLEVPAETG